MTSYLDRTSWQELKASLTTFSALSYPIRKSVVNVSAVPIPGLHLKDPLISSECICMDEAVVLLNRGSFIEQDDRWNETYMHDAVQGCQELSRQYSC
jgi:hypothetical protein